MHRDRPVASIPSLLSRCLQSVSTPLALTLLPLGSAMADAAPAVTQATGPAIDAKTIILLVLAVAVAGGLRYVMRVYREGDNKMQGSRRQRMQPNL